MQLTQAQVDALKKVHAILGEHFDAHVVLTVQDDGGRRESLRTSHSGGWHQALGMIEQAAYCYKAQDMDSSDAVDGG